MSRHTVSQTQTLQLPSLSWNKSHKRVHVICLIKKIKITERLSHVRTLLSLELDYLSSSENIVQ